MCFSFRAKYVVWLMLRLRYLLIRLLLFVYLGVCVFSFWWWDCETRAGQDGLFSWGFFLVRFFKAIDEFVFGCM